MAQLFLFVLETLKGRILSNPDESYDIRLKTTRSLDFRSKSIRFVDNVEIRFCFDAVQPFLEQVIEYGSKVSGSFGGVMA